MAADERRTLNIELRTLNGGVETTDYGTTGPQDQEMTKDRGQTEDVSGQRSAVSGQMADDKDV
jgi:hypothetical protein